MVRNAIFRVQLRQYLRCLFYAFLLLPPWVRGEATTLADDKLVASLGPNVEILVDPSHELNIHQVTLPRFSANFRPSGETVPNLGYTRSAVWVRFSVKNLTFSDPWILQAAYPDMDNVELYMGEGLNWEVVELGQKLPFSSRKIINRDLLFQVFLPFGKETTFYLRYQNETGMTLPIKLFSSQQYQDYALAEQLLFGIFFGFMLVLALYNLILFAKVRESGYLHYFLYISGYGLFQFSLYGLAHQYLWPAWTSWANQNLPFFLAFAFFCRILFTMSVLDSKGNTPRLHQVLKVLVAAPLLSIVYHALTVFHLLPAALVLDSRVALGIAALYFTAFTIVILMVNLRCLGKRVPAARSFMVAWIFMVSGMILYALKSLGVLPSNFITEFGMLFGSVGEMCLLFISLGESIQAIKLQAQEEHRRQQAAIHAYQDEQIRAMRLELELLKANIQPHFMLNSINAAIMWIKEDPATAEKLLHALSRELKLLLRIVGEKVIPIDEEIRICRLHLEVMSLRHDKRFALRLEGIRSEEVIPPMVFHTLVENGLTHGYAGKEEGVFVLSRSEDEANIRYSLFNDGQAGSKSVESSGLGLKYVRARLGEAYGRKWGLDSHAVEGGWRVTIAIEKAAGGLAPEPEGARSAALAGTGSAAKP